MEQLLCETPSQQKVYQTMGEEKLALGKDQDNQVSANKSTYYFPLSHLSFKHERVRVRFDNFPEFSEVLVQILVVYFIEDFTFYWAHRLFHTPLLYKLHKVHHQNDTLYTWVTEYFHPVDFFFGNLLPAGAGFMIIGNYAHCFIFLFRYSYKVMISTQTHSGYEFQWSPTRIIPFIFGPSYHDHHHIHNVGNFAGSCYLWDLIFDTNIPFIKEYMKK